MIFLRCEGTSVFLDCHYSLMSSIPIYNAIDTFSWLLLEQMSLEKVSDDGWALLTGVRRRASIRGGF